MPRTGKVAQGLRQEFARLVEIHGESDLLSLYLENGVYNFYLQDDAGSGKRAAGADAVRPTGGTVAAANGSTRPEEERLEELPDTEQEAQKPRSVRGPATPSNAGRREQNELEHTQYISWCGICVRARGLGQPPAQDLL